MNTGAAVGFLSRFFAQTRGLIELRFIAAGVVKQQVFTRDEAELARVIQSRCRDSNIYFGCGTRAERQENGDKTLRGDKLHTAFIPALYTDLDFEDLGGGDNLDEILKTGSQRAQAILADFELKPSIVIASGGGLHLYWLLHDPVNAHDPRLEPILKGLARRLEADESCGEIARVLRVPGTLNLKREHKAMVTIRWQDWNLRYDLLDFERFAIEPQNALSPKPNAAAVVVNPDERYPALEIVKRMMQQCLPGNRDNAMLSCFVQLRENRYTEGEATAFEKDVFARVPEHPDPTNKITLADVARCRRSAYKDGPRGEPWKLPEGLRKAVTEKSEAAMEANAAKRQPKPETGSQSPMRTASAPPEAELASGTLEGKQSAPDADGGASRVLLLSSELRRGEGQIFATEDWGNAERVVALHGKDMYYCHEFSKSGLLSNLSWEMVRMG